MHRKPLPTAIGTPLSGQLYDQSLRFAEAEARSKLPMGAYVDPDVAQVAETARARSSADEAGKMLRMQIRGLQQLRQDPEVLGASLWRRSGPGGIHSRGFDEYARRVAGQIEQAKLEQAIQGQRPQMNAEGMVQTEYSPSEAMRRSAILSKARRRGHRNIKEAKLGLKKAIGPYG